MDECMADNDELIAAKLHIMLIAVGMAIAITNCMCDCVSSEHPHTGTYGAVVRMLYIMCPWLAYTLHSDEFYATPGLCFEQDCSEEHGTTLQ